MDDEQNEVRNTFAGVFASNESISEMDYWTAKDMARKMRDYSSECTLDEREAVNASIVLAEKRVMQLSGTDGAYAESDQQAKNKEIVEDMLKQGNMKGALQMSQSLKESGMEVVGVHINREAVQPYLDSIEKARKERTPILMDQLNISEEDAIEHFNHYEAHAYGNAPNLLGTAPEPEPEKPKAKGSLPSDEHLIQWSSKP